MAKMVPISKTDTFQLLTSRGREKMINIPFLKHVKQLLWRQNPLVVECSEHTLNKLRDHASEIEETLH